MSSYLFRKTGFSSKERDVRFKLLGAFEKARNRNSIKQGDRQLLHPKAGRALVAVNSDGRVRWAQALCQEFADYFNLDEDCTYPDQRLFFVTLVDHGCFTSPDDQEADIAGFIKHLRPGLRGLSYIGMLEPAYYVNIAPTELFSGRRALFWHVHAICWGETAQQIRDRIADVNKSKRYRPIAEGMPGAHQKRIPRAHDSTYHLAEAFAYMLKSPRNAYRLYQPRSLDGDAIATFRQRKSQLRPGERIDLFHQLKKQHLDRLALAGGEGVDILRRAKRLCAAGY